jgi:hypothetical protein
MTAVAVDALARLEPVARPLLTEVDRALATLGAPPEHGVWAALRRVGATPGDVVAVIAATEPDRLRATADTLRERAHAYDATPVAAPTGWHGPAATAYAHHAAALGAHLGGDGADDARSMAGRLRATAEYAEATADWYQQTRSQLARALADVLTSGQAVTIRASAAGSVDALRAAADIAQHLLDAVDDAIAAGDELTRAWAGQLDELPFTAPAEAVAVRSDSVVDLRP